MEFKEELLLVFKGVLSRSECLGFFDSIGFFGVFGSGLSCAAVVMGEGWYILRPLFWPFYSSVVCFAVVSYWYSCCLAWQCWALLVFPTQFVNFEGLSWREWVKLILHVVLLR